MNNDDLKQLRQIIREENEPIKKDLQGVKQDMATKEDVKRVQNYAENIELKVELINERTKRTESSVKKIDDGLVEMKPKIDRIAEDQEERITELEKHSITHKN